MRSRCTAMIPSRRWRRPGNGCVPLRRTNEELAMKLLGLAWAKADAATSQGWRRTAGAQRQDGGWAQLHGWRAMPTRPGRHWSRSRLQDVSRQRSAYLRGAWLPPPDPVPGWDVACSYRSFPFQPYKESGFPHGNDQWISAAGASWATMALTLSLPPGGSQVSRLY